MQTKRVRKFVEAHIAVVVYVLFAVCIFLTLALYRAQTDARIDGDNAVTKSQIDELNELRQERDVANCLGGVDFRLAVIGLAEDQLSPLPIDADAPPDVRSQVETINRRNAKFLTTVRTRFAPPGCVAQLGLDADGDGWPEAMEPPPVLATKTTTVPS